MKTITILFSIPLILVTLSSCKVVDKIKDNFTEDYVSQPNESFSKPTDPARVLPTNPTGCPNWQKNTVVEITESITLPAGCKYDRVQLHVSYKSDLTLDCNGAELNGLETEFRQALDVPYSEERAPLRYGISIVSGENYQSRNVTVKNCKVKNFEKGIDIAFTMSDESISDLKNNINIVDLENYLREKSPKNIKVENCEIDFSHRDGVFIGRYITDFTINNSVIRNTGSVGLYIDSGSQKNTIENSTFSENGHSQYSRSKRVRTPRFLSTAREGIAIDSSAHNTIKDNNFSENAGGSVFIYKNCNEHHEIQTPRYQSSDHNLITNNTFEDEEVAVWVASRQSKDLSGFDCGIPLMDTGTVSFGPKKEDTKLYEDFAKDNQVTNNTFKTVQYGVIVEDDNTNILGNNFNGGVKFDIIVGTKYRTRAKSHPVTNTRIENNNFNSTTSKHIELAYEPVEVYINNNMPEAVNN